MGRLKRAPRPVSNVCAADDCENPENGRLTPDHYHHASHVYLDGTKARYRKCKMCQALQSERRKAARLADEPAPEPERKEQDWSEFKNYTWDVRAANNYIRGML